MGELITERFETAPRPEAVLYMLETYDAYVAARQKIADRQIGQAIADELSLTEARFFWAESQLTDWEKNIAWQRIREAAKSNAA